MSALVWAWGANVILGLDLSTTCTGWAVLAEDGALLELGHVALDKCETLWAKIDATQAAVAGVAARYSVLGLFIEQPMATFAKGNGASSANVLILLGKFNGAVSYLARRITGVEPVHITSGEARKACGIRLTTRRKSVRGMGHKEQTFNQITSTLLQGRIWELKRGYDRTKTLAERVRSSAMDEVDAYVVARAGWRLGLRAPVYSQPKLATGGEGANESTTANGRADTACAVHKDGGGGVGGGVPRRVWRVGVPTDSRSGEPRVADVRRKPDGVPSRARGGLRLIVGGASGGAGGRGRAKP